MKFGSYLIAASFLLVAATPFAAANVQDLVGVIADDCSEFCKACNDAFAKACGGVGDYDCGEEFWGDDCVCEFECHGKFLTNLEAAA